METNNGKELADAMRANNLLDATKKTGKKKPEVHVGDEEFKAMKKSNYKENKNNVDVSYVIQNTRTGKIVEIKALSAVLAAKAVGWRPRHTRVLQVNEPENKE